MQHRPFLYSLSLSALSPQLPPSFAPPPPPNSSWLSACPLSVPNERLLGKICGFHSPALPGFQWLSSQAICFCFLAAEKCKPSWHTPAWWPWTDGFRIGNMTFFSIPSPSVEAIRNTVLLNQWITKALFGPVHNSQLFKSVTEVSIGGWLIAGQRNYTFTVRLVHSSNRTAQFTKGLNHITDW